MVLFCEMSRSLSEDAVTPPGKALAMPPMVSGAAIASTEAAESVPMPACELMALTIDEAWLPSTDATMVAIHACHWLRQGSIDKHLT